jgi:asparagine synthase (glutamine-hydrolysing)
LRCSGIATPLDGCTSRPDSTLSAKDLARPPALSESGLSEYLRFLDIAAPNTLYEGVFALEAGQTVEFTASGHRELTTAVPEVTPPATYDAACDEVERRLQAAIDRRLAGSAAPAAFLSGGLDSALLCALARTGRSPRRHLHGRLRCAVTRRIGDGGTHCAPSGP